MAFANFIGFLVAYVVNIYESILQLSVNCFRFCLPSSAPISARKAHDEPSSCCCCSSSPVDDGAHHEKTMETNENKEVLSPTKNTNIITGKINSLFQEHEFGKTAMGYVAPAIVILLINATVFSGLVLNVVVITFSFGFVIIWNGIMLRNLFPRFCTVVEQLGVVIVFLGFFSLVASVLPLSFLWAPFLCGFLFLFPFILSHCVFLHRTSLLRTAASPSPPLLPIITPKLPAS